MIFRVSLAVLLSSVAGTAIDAGRTAAAQAASAKAAWEWTHEERLAALRDPAKVHQRTEAARRSHANASTLPNADDVIDGSMNPELFLPTELFDRLTRGLVSAPQFWSERVRRRSTDLFQDPSEWQRFLSIAAELIETHRAERGAASAADKAAIESRCAVSARALREARRVFGKSRFDRMLYEAIAPGVVSYRSSTSAQALVEYEEKCR